MGRILEFERAFNDAFADRSPRFAFEAFVYDFATLFAKATPWDFGWLSDRHAALMRGAGAEAASRLAALREIVVDAYEEDADQDFLGTAYTDLGLNDGKRGQHFTPYEVSKLMAATAIEPDRLEREIAERGFVAVGDPCAGSGAMLVACANRLRELGVNYQRKAVFEAWEIDETTAVMCYVQMSLLGMPGIVVAGDSVTGEPRRIMITPLLRPSPALLIQLTRRAEEYGRIKKGNGDRGASAR